MTSKPDTQQQHAEAVDRLIGLANEMMNKEGLSKQVVSAALMSASGVFATFVAAGNQGYLMDSGIDKVTQAYKNNLIGIQKFKKARAGEQNKTQASS